jgi:hypothetical protein
MRFDRRIFAVLIPVLVVSATAFLVADETRPTEPTGLTVHEWGTFTSIAGDDGMAVNWTPLDGPTDLPCFVYRFEYGAKANLRGTVRMETPVMYFYGPETTTADVRIGFPNGFITEWYPKSKRVATYLGSGIPPTGPDVRQPRGDEPDSIEWTQIKLEPGVEARDFPFENASSHYYAARSTDATPLLVGNEKEKFLFYRGVGRFQPPIAARVNASEEITVENLGRDRIPAAILFENHEGKIFYRVSGPIDRATTLGAPQFDAPQVVSDTGMLRTEIEKILVSQGLFPKEAKAMVATWGDSWFEEGTRVFYFLPTTAVDLLLPLEIQPAPAQIARVFVGRMEVITPATKNAITGALARGDWGPLTRYGRFLDPIAMKMGQGAWTKQLASMRADYLRRETACGADNR